jgi:hypothetical protein
MNKEFIELTGKTLLDVVNEGEVDLKQLHDSNCAVAKTGFLLAV